MENTELSSLLQSLLPDRRALDLGRLDQDGLDALGLLEAEVRDAVERVRESGVDTGDARFAGLVSTRAALQLARREKITNMALWLLAWLVRKSGIYLTMGYEDYGDWLANLGHEQIAVSKSELASMRFVTTYLLPEAERIGIPAEQILLRPGVKTKLREAVGPARTLLAQPGSDHEKRAHLERLITAVMDPEISKRDLESLTVDMGLRDAKPPVVCYTTEAPLVTCFPFLLLPRTWEEALALRRFLSDIVDERTADGFQEVYRILQKLEQGDSSPLD